MFNIQAAAADMSDIRKFLAQHAKGPDMPTPLMLTAQVIESMDRMSDQLAMLSGAVESLMQENVYVAMQALRDLRNHVAESNKLCEKDTRELSRFFRNEGAFKSFRAAQQRDPGGDPATSGVQRSNPSPFTKLLADLLASGALLTGPELLASGALITGAKRREASEPAASGQHSGGQAGPFSGVPVAPTPAGGQLIAAERLPTVAQPVAAQPKEGRKVRNARGLGGSDGRARKPTGGARKGGKRPAGRSK